LARRDGQTATCLFWLERRESDFVLTQIHRLWRRRYCAGHTRSFTQSRKGLQSTTDCACGRLMRGATVRVLRLSFFPQENTSDNRLDVPAKDRKEREFVVRIVRIALRLRCAVALPTTEPPRLQPGVRSWLACRACIASVRFSTLCRERIPVHRQ